MKVKITADSVCDLSPEQRERYGLNILPLYVMLDGKEHRDGLDIIPEDIYAHVAAGGDLGSTAALSVADYIEFFGKELEDCDELIHFHISSSMSSCYQNACIAAEEIENVYPIDSANLSTGIGLLIIDACEMAAQGMSAEEIVEEINARRCKVEASFVVDSVNYLHKGGRCSAVAALGANLLGLKPCIEVSDGAMGVAKKYRGKIGKCLLQYVRERLEGREDIKLNRIFITNSGEFTEDELKAVEDEVRKYQSFDEILFSRAGCTVSNHCGPKTLGILFERK
ncbi:MAG: DegV family protein [Oscillospiraceae bacterium]|nr:DegV family protein [Oscillospiraceae bacterium]